MTDLNVVQPLSIALIGASFVTILGIEVLLRFRPRRKNRSRAAEAYIV